MTRPAHPVRVASLASTTDERGFTLIELMIVTVIVPIIIGALSVSLISIFSLQSSVSNRLGDSANSQVVTTSFTSDVQRATWVTTSPTLSQCGTGTQLLAIQLGSGDFISYNALAQSNALYSLVRDQCGASTTATTPPGTPGALTSSATVAYDLNQPCIIGSVSNCLQVQAFSNSTLQQVLSSSWVLTQGITSVQFHVYANQSKYSYVVAAEPLGVDSSLTSTLGTIGAGDSCGFALPGTGTYASQLCFFDFANLFTGGNVPNNRPFTELVPGGYVLTGDVTVTGAPVVAAVKFPTWQNAFLGNANAAGQPFYSGVGCPVGTPTTITKVTNGNLVVYGQPSCISPAIYQQGSAGGQSNTISFTNISLVTASGQPVSGYEIVTADAETTDNGESIAWSSNLNFTQIPDSPSASPANPALYEGNACSTNINGVLTYGGDITNAAGQVLAMPVTNTPTVTCHSDWSASSPRTGTLMLGVTPPSSGVGANGSTNIQAVITGTGLEGVTFGLLLP